MMTILSLVQKLVKTLNSEGTPGQVAVGIALGAALGLTPLMNLHNLLILLAAMVLQVTFPAVLLGWALFLPLGFLLDPLFHEVGTLLLMDAGGLRPIWTALYNAPVMALTGFNNTVVLGSFVSWVLLFTPIYFAARWGVARYRETIYRRLERSRLFKAVKASKAYNLYRLFRPE